MDSNLEKSSNGDFSSDHQEQVQMSANIMNNVQSFVNLSPATSETPFIGQSQVRQDLDHNLSEFPVMVCCHGNSESCSRGTKRKRNVDKEMEKPKEVIHVRAKRGQATDGHSLAERVRREKINERLRCLQELVPGCYKTMGMAVMLDVISNYIQSLQNQIEFLSMKLSATSMNFTSLEMETLQRMEGTNAFVQEMEKMIRDGYGGTSHYYNSTHL
ncbi:hypothetical protein K2173_016994 [Erythroxylum novogranatense]|uniref:BHLH domain-containing protein n=1 Tax=Erythroxylum novogranatense TaxID=1862640 RepID=A0AAV8U892_9ROSI|nr:hypothetical protein K2173_016994 [Erythroxylum novogranatense]